MTPIRRPEIEDEAWIAWREEAKRAITELMKDYTPGSAVTVKEELYQRAKPHLLKLSYGKCAYCESIISSQQPGDVEHYRPKGRIKELNGRVVKMMLDGKELDHPGYWWLCYEWLNLLPSCIDCNRRRYHGDEETPVGKAELFPIAGKRATGPHDTLSDEQALLLDPSDPQFDPDHHFEFTRKGEIAPKTKEAETSCDLLGLNLRETLVKLRAESYTTAELVFSQFLLVSSQAAMGAPMESMEKELRIRINGMWEGRAQYSAFAKRALLNVRRNLKAKSISIDFPLSVEE